MTNFDQQQRIPTNDSLATEIGESFSDLLASSDQPEETDNMDALVSLFDKNFVDDSGDDLDFSFIDEESLDSSPLTSLPSTEEISEVFTTNFASLDRNQRTFETDFPDDFGQTMVNEEVSDLRSQLVDEDLATLLGFEPNQEDETENSSWLEDFKSDSQAVLEGNQLEELKQLLTDEDLQDESILTELISPEMVSRIESEISSLEWYPSFEELETLLEQPSSFMLDELNSAVSYADLEAWLETPVTQSEQLIHKAVSPFPEPTATQAQLKDSLDFQKDTENPDDAFGDLEKLLEVADCTMGGTPSFKTTTGQRLPSRSRTVKPKIFEQTMRVPVKQLDNLSNLIGELVVKRNRLEQDQERLRQFLDNLLNQVQNLGDVGGRMQDLYERTLLEGALLASRHQAIPGSSYDSSLLSSVQIQEDGEDVFRPEELDQGFTGFHLLSQEIMELIVRIRESSSDIQFLVDETDQVARTLRQVTTQLQEGMTKSRMVPFAQTADRLPRAIREISLKLNKQAKLHVEGREVLIDKVILEHLYNPMTHLVNNAITHGLETPEVRTAQGKSPTGRVTVSSFLQGNQTIISVSDDGAGINPERVKAKAIEKGLITPAEARTLSPAEVYDFLFHPGFSTKDQADDFSGRGVGLDVVSTSLSEIRGTVSIDSTLGKGTTFTIRLPLTLSICKALCCLSNHARIAFPLDGVEDTKDYTPTDIQINPEGVRAVRWRDNILPIYSLSDLLSYNRQLSRGTVYGGKQQEDDLISIVILRSAGNLLAVEVDQVLGEQEIVIKQIEGPIPKPPGIAGATVLGDGAIMPIADVLELIEISLGRVRTDGGTSLWRKTSFPMEPENEVPIKTEPLVLIVDDSITVRELLSLSFTKAGYRVEQARDGQEAWEKLRSGLPCDLVFCDIEMPRMNGLELLANLQKEESLAGIPVALLTSRGAERHRNVAAKLGASAYLTKPYTERDLLDAAQRMIAGEILLANSIKATDKDKANIPLKTQSMVLIIDDSVMVREMLSMTFQKAGYQVEQARDGQEAWEKLRSGLACDLALCDIEMPRMNGLELLSRLQEDEQLSSVPVAMITSRGAERHRKIAAERGAKGYFTKPYIEEVLLDAVPRLIAGEVLL